MDNVYTFYSKDIEELVKNLKSTFFDVVATNQQNINNLEEAIVNATDPELENRYRTAWATYHEALKSAINVASVLTDSMKQLDQCTGEYNRIVTGEFNNLNNSTQIVQEQIVAPEENIISNEKIQEEVSEKEEAPIEEAKPEEVKEEAPVEEAKPEEVKEEAPVEEAKPEEVKEEAPAEEAKPEEVKEEAPIEEAKPEEVKEEAPAEEAKPEEVKEEAPAEEAKPEEVKEEAPIEEAKPEEAKEEAPAEEAKPEEVKEEAPAEEEVLGGMFADPDTYSELNGLTGGVTGEMPGATTASAAVVNIPEKTDDSTEIELPTIDLDIEDTKTEEAAPAEEAKTEESITALGEDDNKATVINEGSPDGKAIIVTNAQVTKLRASKETQKVLLNNKTNEIPKSDEISPEKQLEEMMTQLPLLYEQGKTEEAAAMSEKISVLSKQLNPSA